MMTIDKLKVYIKFNGEFDKFFEYMDKLNPEEHEYALVERDMDTVDFNYIDNALQEINWIKNKLVADSYGEEIIKGMRSYMDEDAFSLLWEMSDKY